MIYLLCLVFLFLLVICYFIFKKELATPSIILCFVYLVSSICACLNVDEWGIKLSNKTFLVFVLGAIEFILINFIVFKFFKVKNKANSKYHFNEIKINRILLILLIIYDIIVLFLLYKNVLNIANRYGEYSSFSQALTIFKNHTSYNKDASLPGYLTILMKPIVAGAYVSIYIFLNNIFASKNKIKVSIKNNFIYLIFPILYIIQRFMESNRGSILNLFVSLVVLLIIMWSIRNQWKKIVSIKSILKLIVCAIVGLLLFYYSASLVGRINNKNLYRYVTYYVGGSIECFNRWFDFPDRIESFRGEYTFARTVNDLNQLHITDKKVINKNYSKFVYYKGKMVGNIYTAYRSWIHDFGIIGMIVLQAIYSFVISVLYYLVRYGKSNKWYPYKIIIYGYLSYTIFMHPIDSYFYLETFTKSTLFLFIMIIVMLWFANNYRLLCEKIKSRKEKNI